MVVLQVTNLNKLFQKYVDKDTSKKVSNKIFYVVRRIMIVGLLIAQDRIPSFETAFVMFTINSLFVCINIKYTLNRMDFLYYCVSEIPVIVFGFITISFTSYNLDIYDKQKISLIGIFLVLLGYLTLFSLRVYDIVKYYKAKQQGELYDIKRDTTNQNMMKEPYQDEGEIDNGIEHVREGMRKSIEDARTPRSAQKQSVTKRRSKLPQQKEEYKF